MKGAPPIRRVVMLMAALAIIALVRGFADRLTTHAGLLTDIMTGVFFVWCAVFTVTMLHVIVFAMSIRPKASPLAVSLSLHGFVPTLIRALRRKKGIEFNYAVLSVLLGTVILALVAGTSLNRMLDGAEHYCVPQSAIVHDQESESIVRVFVFSTGDNNATRYLRDLAGLVWMFKSAGVRTVVAEIPYVLEENGVQAAFLDSIRQSGIAVWHHSPDLRQANFRYPSDLSAKELAVPVKESYYTDLCEAEGGDFVSWYPYLRSGPYGFPSAALGAVGKYYGYPDSIAHVCLSDRVLYGSLSIPVGTGGIALSARTFLPDKGFSGYASVVAFRPLDSDTIWYADRFAPYGTETTTYPAALMGELRDRIIVVCWDNGENRGRRAMALANSIESLLRNKVYHDCEHASLIVSAFVVLLGALVSSRISPVRAALTMASLGVLLFLGSLWMLVSAHLFLHMAYCSFAAFLSAAAFPLLKVAQEESIVLALKARDGSDPHI
jgi:hypothetical protein